MLFLSLKKKENWVSRAGSTLAWLAYSEDFQRDSLLLAKGNDSHFLRLKIVGWYDPEFQTLNTERRAGRQPGNLDCLWPGQESNQQPWSRPTLDHCCFRRYSRGCVCVCVKERKRKRRPHHPVDGSHRAPSNCRWWIDAHCRHDSHWHWLKANQTITPTSTRTHAHHFSFTFALSIFQSSPTEPKGPLRISDMSCCAKLDYRGNSQKSTEGWENNNGPAGGQYESICSCFEKCHLLPCVTILADVLHVFLCVCL